MKLKNLDLVEKSFNRALFFLKFRPRSEKEIRDFLFKYLHKKKIPQDIQESVVKATIKRLKELKFVDDHDFVRFWVERRFQVNPKGKKILSFELRQKGIAAEIIDEILDLEMSKYAKEDTLRKLLEKADIHYHNLPSIERRQKLINFVLRRGFSFSEVERIVDELTKKQ